MLPYQPGAALRIGDYRVRSSDRPGWLAGTTRLPRVGEEVFCAAGVGVVVGLGGRTGDGSRLLEIRLREAPGRSFFAAASNVLLPPPGTRAPDADPGLPVRAPSEVWIGAPAVREHAGPDALLQDGPRAIDGVHRSTIGVSHETDRPIAGPPTA